MAEPRNADAIPGLEAIDPFTERANGTDDLVARYDRQFRLGQIAVDDMQIGAAHAAGRYRYLYLARSGFRIGFLDQFQWGSGLLENHCFHAFLILGLVVSVSLPVIPAVSAKRMASSMLILQGRMSSFGTSSV